MDWFFFIWSLSGSVLFSYSVLRNGRKGPDLLEHLAGFFMSLTLGPFTPPSLYVDAEKVCIRLIAALTILWSAIVWVLSN